MTGAANSPPGLPEIDGLRTIRIVGRLTVAYLLDVIAISRGDGPPIDMLLAAAVIQANVADLNNRAELEAFIGHDEMPTDDQRRPVSVNAVATSLGMPFETVRRRINAMVRDGYCKAVDGGVIVPSAVLADPKYYASAYQAYERLRAFYYQLRDHGVLVGLPEPTVELTAGNFPIRLVSRLVGAYVLRIVESMGVHGDLIDGLILFETFRSNIEHLDPGRLGSVEDHERAPMAVTTVAARLGLPAETVRRRCVGLLERGALARRRGGLIVPSVTLGDPRVFAAISGNAGNLQRLFATLSRLGVLKVWDDLQPAAETAGAA